jgi:hypothetical protein
LFGYEFKWKETSIKKAVKQEFLSNYSEAELKVVNQENFGEFLK